MGVKGFYVCGSTGEAFLLSTGERKQVMEIVKDCAKDATLIAYIGSVNEAEVTELAKCAEKFGYNAICFEAGDCNFSHFSRLFKFFCGIVKKSCNIKKFVI